MQFSATILHVNDKIIEQAVSQYKINEIKWQ